MTDDLAALRAEIADLKARLALRRLRCGFCGKEEQEVARMIAAPGAGANICGECVAVCVGALTSAPAPGGRGG